MGPTAVIASALVLASCNTMPRTTSTQSTPPSPQFSEIARMDDSLSAAFNAHNLDGLMALFAADVEFYHDTQGLQRYDAVRAGFAGLIGAGNRIRRQREGSIDVYPLRDYGAIEVGRHRFCHEEASRTDCGAFAFVHVSRRENGGWRISRVVSYGH